MFYLNICFSPSLILNKKTMFSFSLKTLIVSVIIFLSFHKSLLSYFFLLILVFLYALTRILIFTNSDFMEFVPVHLFTAVHTSAHFIFYSSKFLASELIVFSNGISTAASENEFPEQFKEIRSILNYAFGF